MKIPTLNLTPERPRVMTILNVTPDSFYAGSRFFTAAEIALRAEKAAVEGADWIDIGGYSSRPGAPDVSPEEEWHRVERALETVRRIVPDMPLSIDTFRAEVARRAVEQYGVELVNDISAGTLDAAMPATVAALGVGYVAMHMRGTPADMQQQTGYGDVVEELLAYFRERIRMLEQAGVKTIVVDPGFGFAKTPEQNYRLLMGMHRLRELGRPILTGISRKSMIYKVLDIEPEDALTGTTALHWECLRQGALILRVHDTLAARQVVDLYRFAVRCSEKEVVEQ